MSINITDSDGVTSIQIPDRLEADLLKADGNVEDIEITIYFKVKTILPSGKVVGEPYLDTATPLTLNCKENPELAEAMRLIQQAIGLGRYQQMTAPIPKPVENLEMIPLIENS